MGSVISTEQCPHCKTENLYVDFRYKTGEETSQCIACGYYRHHRIKRNDHNNDIVLIDKTKPLTFDNIYWDDVEKEPYGLLITSYIEDDIKQLITITSIEHKEGQIKCTLEDEDYIATIKTIVFQQYTGDELNPINRELIYDKEAIDV